MKFTVILEQLGLGFLQTLLIFAVTLILSLPLGWVVYFGRASGKKAVSGLFGAFISIMRGTPLMLQLLLWYFGPYYLFEANIANYKFTALMIGFSLNYSAYFAEIYRSGVEAIDVGQYEAAQILGYTPFQTFIRVIFPQVMRIVMPSIGNEVITLVKDTSLAYSISYIEMFALAKQIAAKETTIIPFIVAGVFYYIFNYAVAKGISYTERKLAYY